MVAIVSMWFILNDIDKKKQERGTHNREGCGDACVSTDDLSWLAATLRADPNAMIDIPPNYLG